MADEETKVEEVQETAEAPPEVSIEDIKAQLEEARGQISERDAKLKGLRQSAAKRSEREHKLTDTLDAMNKRLEMTEEQGAGILDILESQNEGLETPERQTHKQKLDLQRVERGKAKTETPVDPAVTKFVNYVDEHDLKRDSALVTEAAEDRSPTEALDYLRDKIKAQDDAKIAKLVEEGVQIQVEQELKKSGLTSKGAGGPNAASQDDDAFMLTFSEGKSDDYARAQKILTGKK